MVAYTDQERKLAQFFVEREGEGILEELRAIDFFDSGVLDSLDLVTLGVFIQKTFGKRIDLADSETFEKARHFDTLVELIT